MRLRLEDSLLAISEFAQGSAMLPLHADRVIAFLRETAPVKDNRSVWFTKVFCDQLLMPLQNTITAPSAFADELLDGSDGIDVFSAFARVVSVVIDDNIFAWCASVM